MSANLDVVWTVLHGWPTMPAATLAACFTVDAVYRNMPVPEAVIGGEQIAASLQGWVVGRIERVDVEERLVVEHGDVVVVERLETFHPITGPSFDIPVVGVFELRDGRIAAWRDYFDLAQWRLEPGGTGDAGASAS